MNTKRDDDALIPLKLPGAPTSAGPTEKRHFLIQRHILRLAMIDMQALNRGYDTGSGILCSASQTVPPSEVRGNVRQFRTGRCINSLSTCKWVVVNKISGTLMCTTCLSVRKTYISVYSPG